MPAVLAIILVWLSATAFAAPASTDNLTGDTYVPPADSITVSLITCWPGSEIYELYGHEAIRVRGEGRDSVWNFGVFDYREPNFVYRFVKGETDYLCAGYPFEWFLPEYMQRGSKVVEQDLNLTSDEARQLLGMLRENALPQNRYYRYNYVKDNCATRIRDMVEKATGGEGVYPDSVRYGTFRNEMRVYNRHYPWYQFGIDLALGGGIDYPLTAREEMFVPVEMFRMMEDGRFADGRAAVRETRVLYEGLPDATLPQTAWWLTPLFWSWIFFTFSLAVGIADIKRRKISRWVYSLWFLSIGLVGCVSAFLVFISSHEATSPNSLIIWLNPLQLLFGIFIWLKKGRWVCLAMSWYDIVATVSLLVVWPFQAQSTNPAIFPLVGATLALSVAYAISAHKESYYNKAHTPVKGKSAGRKKDK